MLIGDDLPESDNRTALLFIIGIEICTHARSTRNSLTVSHQMTELAQCG